MSPSATNPLLVPSSEDSFRLLKDCFRLSWYMVMAFLSPPPVGLRFRRELVTISPGVFPPYLIVLVCCFEEEDVEELESTILLSPGLLVVTLTGWTSLPSVSDRAAGDGGLIWSMIAWGVILVLGGLWLLIIDFEGGGLLLLMLALVLSSSNDTCVMTFSECLFLECLPRVGRVCERLV